MLRIESQCSGNRRSLFPVLDTQFSIPHHDRTPFVCVGRQEMCRRGHILDSGRQFPRQVMRILHQIPHIQRTYHVEIYLNSGVHTEASCWWEDMSCISRNKDMSSLKCIQSVRFHDPWTNGFDLRDPMSRQLRSASFTRTSFSGNPAACRIRSAQCS